MSDMFSQDPEVLDFWKGIEDAEKAGRSGGTVLQVNLSFGWKVFSKKDEGFDNDQTFFPYTVGDKDSISKARSLANKFIVENGLTKNPFNVFQVVLKRDTVLNREVSWKEEKKYFYFFTTGSAYTEMVAPAMYAALKDLGVKHLGDFWAEIVWAEDRGGKTRLMQKMEGGIAVVDENGDPVMEERLPMIAYPVKLFADRAAAAEYCGDSIIVDHEEEDATTSVEETQLPIPEGYDKETWDGTIKEIKLELGRGSKPQKIAADYGLPRKTVDEIARQK